MINTFEASHQLCNVTLLGNLVAKPEIRYLANPVLAVTDIVLATTYRWKDKNNHNKEWTSYHHVKVVGKLVEESLQHANKGDILLVNGYIANNKTKPIEIVHATTIEHFAKGFTQNINNITCSAQLTTDVKLVTTESNNQLATFEISICHHAFSEHKSESLIHHVKRPVQLWGAQAQNIAQQAKQGDNVIVEGRLSYANNQQKSQQIDASQVHLLAK
ncbi:single-stranded DNA-binding protein [Thalassotalea sp. M1531]|uniref:Plasmid-derived single-stranded DNA-binding protein n=1 Tax=Thalassotalea algicola TaxID=2716224 RepID=A0A7Y0L9Q5_9GAMM|nr:single-stranded DNA-binding protein [Thalassotalea algicola]NMP30553.1 single-stranded DNA-binding protein [Thalassotalea algicola]